MTTHTISIREDYEVPAGQLTREQYIEFVMNMAAQSYKAQYRTATVVEGVQAACDAYNAAIPADPQQEQNNG